MVFNNENKILITKNTIKLSGTFLRPNSLTPTDNKIYLTYKYNDEPIIGITQSNIFCNFLKQGQKYIIHKKDTSFPCPDSISGEAISMKDNNYLLDTDLSHHLLYDVSQVTSFWKDMKYPINLYDYYSTSYNHPKAESEISFNVTKTDMNFELTYVNNNIYNILFKKILIDISFSYEVTVTQSQQILENNSIVLGQYLFCYKKYIDYITLYLFEGYTSSTSLKILIEQHLSSLPNDIIGSGMYIEVISTIQQTSNGNLDVYITNSDSDVNIVYTPYKVLIPNYPNAKKTCKNKNINQNEYENFIGTDHCYIEIWLYDKKEKIYILEELHITYIVECNNKKCPPKILYNPIQDLAIMGSTRSSKMQQAHMIKNASKYRGRCVKKSIINPDASIITSRTTNTFITTGTSSKGKKRAVFAFF